MLYGQELDDGNGVVARSHTVSLKEWSADDEEMSFSASERFDGMNETYYKGLYRESGISLYDLATDVFDDAGVDYRTYWLDPYLKDVLVKILCRLLHTKKHCRLLLMPAGASCIRTARRYLFEI